ncbi:MAG TPA: reverse transcriptase-like protein [Actinomycetota bacterium]|nr:reverse transcriptase-like protein [Actinomycetota bacterium]
MSELVVKVYGEARGSRGLAGTGLIAYNSQGKEIAREANFLGVATRSQAEFRAVLSGLHFARGRSESADLLTAHTTVVQALTRERHGPAAEVVALYAEASNLLEWLPTLALQVVSEEEVEVAARLASVAIDTRGRRRAIG